MTIQEREPVLLGFTRDTNDLTRVTAVHFRNTQEIQAHFPRVCHMLGWEKLLRQERPYVHL